LSYSHIRPTYEITALFDLVFLLLSDLSFTTSTLYIMPPFVPNQYMLDKHNDKGEFDWEIYAWCLRDAMAKTGNFKICDQTMREKLAYEKFMKNQTNSMSYQGKEFHINGDELSDDDKE
jgi:hypothetical protein